MSERPSDPWSDFRKFTAARIALGRSGNGLPTPHLLDFQLAHAQARDAVQAELDIDALSKSLQEGEFPALPVLATTSQAGDRNTFLQRPDLGRRLDARSHALLSDADRKIEPDVVFVIGDGLSAPAIEAYAAATLREALLLISDLTVGPIVIARQARVALGDDVAVALDAQIVVVLIGERPGLSAADSMGAYLTYKPTKDSQNADRNCVSNIREGGLSPSDAAARIVYLLRAAMKQGQSGYQLKDLSQSSEHLEDKRTDG